MKSLKNTLQESLCIGIYDEVKVPVYESLRIGINDQPEISVDELVDEYLKPNFIEGKIVTFPSSEFSIKDACAYPTIEIDVLHAILDNPNIKKELNVFWQEMKKHKIYNFSYQDDMPKFWKENAQYIYDFIQKINNNEELTNLYKSDNFTIDTFESNKYIFFKIHNTSTIYIWIAEK